MTQAPQISTFNRIYSTFLLALTLMIPGCATEDLWGWARESDQGSPEIQPLGIAEGSGQDLLFFRILSSDQGPDSTYSMTVGHCWHELDPKASRVKFGSENLSLRPAAPVSLRPFSRLDDLDPVSAYAVVSGNDPQGKTRRIDIFAARRDLDLWLHLGSLELSPRPTSGWRPLLAGLGTPFTWTFDVVAGTSAILLASGLGLKKWSGSSESSTGFIFH